MWEKLRVWQLSQARRSQQVPCPLEAYVLHRGHLLRVISTVHIRFRPSFSRIRGEIPLSEKCHQSCERVHTLDLQTWKC
jgi:hypothetical protein